MNVVEAIRAVELQTCHVSDEMIWADLPNFQKLALARLFKDDVMALMDDRYNDGFNDGKEEGRDDSRTYLTASEIAEAKIEAYREVKAKLFELIESLETIG